MMKSISLFILPILSTLLVTGCKPSQTVTQTTSRPIPGQYVHAVDTINMASVSWRNYFADQNLVGLIDSALTNNFDARIALQRMEQAKAGVQFSKGALLPTVGALAVPKITRYGLYTMDGAGNITTDIEPGKIVPVNLPDFLVGLQTSWEADITGKLRNRKKAAVARYLASTEGKNWVLTNLVAEVAITYYELLSLDQELEIILETIALQENALSIVTIQKQAGAANELAVKQFQAQVLNTKALALEIKQEMFQIESKINWLLGRFPQPIVRAKESFNVAIPQQIQTGIPSDLLRFRPDVKQAELELMASKADLGAARAAFYPSLFITGGIGYQAYKTNLLFTTPESFVFNLIGNLSAPLINRSIIKAEFNAANAIQIEALYNYRKAILTAYVEVYNEVNNLDNLQNIYALRNDEVSTLSQAIETSTDLFRTGRATYLEVLLAQQNLLSAQLDFIDVKKQQLFGSVNIYKALGGGWN
jgi:outer membrane protein, multidrug efflux system